MIKNCKVLIVDDEANLLRSLQRNLRRLYDVTIAEGGIAGFEQVLQNGPFAVIVTDLQMPDVDGTQVLEMARIISPDTYRIMLTGNVKGNIPLYGPDNRPWFSVVNKPCTTEKLCEFLNEGIDHYGIATSTKQEPSSNSASNSDAPIEAARRDAVGRSQRLRRLVRCLGSSLKLIETYQYELAGLLCQVACLITPESVGPMGNWPCSDQWQQFLQQQSQLSSEIIRRIPRLAGVADMVRFQYAEEIPENTSTSVQRGARIIRMLTDYDVLRRTLSDTAVIDRMKAQSRFYGEELFRTFSELILDGLAAQSIPIGTELSDARPTDSCNVPPNNPLAHS